MKKTMSIILSVIMIFASFGAVPFEASAIIRSCLVTVEAQEGGTAEGGDMYMYGDEVTVVATPNEGYEFDGWYKGDDCLSVDLTYSFTVFEDISLLAKFRLKPYVKTVKAANVTAAYGVDKKYKVCVYNQYNEPVANKNVSVKIGGKTYTLKTNNKGAAYLSIKNLKPKTYKVNIVCDDVKVSSKIVIKKATSKLTAKNKTFKAKVKIKKYTVTLKNNKGKAIKNAVLTAKVKGKTYKAKTNSKGKATFKIKNLTKKGTFKATINYKGNGYYKKVSKKVKIIIK